MLDFIDKEIKSGYEIYFAVENAVSRRYRPIMLTTITTVFGLLPLAFSNSSLFEPMSIALIFGLSLSTLLTLVVIPVIFTLLFDTSKKSKVNQKFNKLLKIKEEIWREI